MKNKVSFFILVEYAKPRKKHEKSPQIKKNKKIQIIFFYPRQVQMVKKTSQSTVPLMTKILTVLYVFIPFVRHVTGNDKDYLRKIPRVVW